MGWKQILREVERANRRSQRAAAQHHRQLVRDRARIDKLEAKQAELASARAEVAEFDSYLEMLVSVHKDCGEMWDWGRIAQSSPPTRPVPGTPLQDAAEAAVRKFVPGFFDKLFGRAKKKVAALEAAVHTAINEDRANNDQLQAQYKQDIVKWDASRQVAAGVLARDPAAYQRALQIAAPFDEVEGYKTRVSVEHAEPGVVVLGCVLQDEEMVPSEEPKLTASGKVSRKAMPASRFWALHQDYVCSCALRVARETLAVLPIDRVIVNVSADRMDLSTGHHGRMTVLAVHFMRKALQSLNMEAIDPSDSLRNFNTRMKFKKTSGFEAVEPITADEQWISA